jgi:hypothetical protein
MIGICEYLLLYHVFCHCLQRAEQWIREMKEQLDELQKMKEVSFSYTFLTSWLLFLQPLSFYADLLIGCHASYLRGKQFES